MPNLFIQQKFSKPKNKPPTTTSAFLPAYTQTISATSSPTGPDFVESKPVSDSNRKIQTIHSKH
jgi:hypothetical protein